jgi:sec-independent protein translocase protein TatC
MAKQPHDDLFEGGTMSFGEHLEELRICLFRSLIGVLVGCCIGLYAAEYVVRFFEGPLEEALIDHYMARALTQIDVDFKKKPPEEYRRTILEDRLVPEKMNVEPAQLARELGFGSINDTAGTPVSANNFVAADFKVEQELPFIKFLVRQEKATAETPARRLWQMLSDDDQAALKKMAESDKPLDDTERRELLAILNRLIAKAELHGSQEFSALAVAKTGTATDLYEALKKTPDADATRRLNKLLIADQFGDFVRQPRLNLVTFYNWKPVKVRFQVLNAQEAFMIYLKAAMLTGIVLASPYVFYQIWIFVAAGLYPHEKSQVFVYLPISMALFFGGASLAFGFVFKPVLNFLFQFNQGLNAEFDPRIGEWLSFVLILPIGFGISFQLPLVMLFVNRLGFASVDLYIQQWRMAILIIFIVAMVLTPADPVSMLLMAIPLCGLYVLGIAMCLWMPKGRSPFDQAYEPSA